MSSYGRPEDPWNTPPTDPWGGHPSSTPPGQEPISPPPHAPPPDAPPFQRPYEAPFPPPFPPSGDQGYSDPAFWAASPAAPPAQPHNRRQTALIITVAVLALLLGVGGFTAFLLSDRTPSAQPSTGPTGPATATAGPTGTATRGPTGSPTGNPPAGDVRNVSVGQCVINEGTETSPVMRVVPCGRDTYEVLARINETADVKRCSTVKDYQFHYFYNSELDSLDFVLCLKRRQ